MPLKTELKLEHFERPDFPLYSSIQEGRRELAIVHYHPALEFIKVIRGRVNVLILDTYYECKSGDIVFIPASVVHGVTSIEQDSAIRGITFGGSFYERAGVINGLTEIFRSTGKTSYIVRREDDVNNELSEYLDKLLMHYGDYSVPGQMMILSALLSAGAVLISHFGLSEQATDRDVIRLRPVFDYIEKNYARKLYISELSGIVHTCDDRFIRLFKDVTGKTPMEYVMSIRIENAIKQLSTTDDPIALVAEQTGFGSDTYMTRVFRNRLNKTPGEYRKRRE